MSESDLFLTPETLDAASAALDTTLRAPKLEDNPTFRAGKADNLGVWAEAFVIRDTDYGKPKTPKEGVDAVVAKVVLEVLGPADGGFTTNAGRVHYHLAYIDRTSLKDPKDRLHSMNMRRVGVLRSLFSAVGLDMSAGISTEDTLKGDGLTKMLVGQRVQGIVRKYTYQGKNGEVLACEIDGFSTLA